MYVLGINQETLFYSVVIPIFKKKKKISIIIPFFFAVFIGTVNSVSQNAPMMCIIVVSDIKTYRLQIF